MSNSGRVKGKVNVDRFDKFVFHHNQENDWQNYIKKNGKSLNKELICSECGFGKSAIFQNPTLKNRVEDLTQDLIKKGILLKQLSEQFKFEYKEQEIFISAFDRKVVDYMNSADRLKEIIISCSQEIDKLLQPVLKD